MTMLKTRFSQLAEGVAALMMAAMFATFILQITIRYTARLDWLQGWLPFLNPNHYGWTLEFCLMLWVWIVFWGNSFIVRERDHVTFDILYTNVNPSLRKWFAIIGGVAVCIGLLMSVEPTWSRFAILRLKRTATLDTLFGSGIRMRHIYSIYMLFLVVVAARYGWRAWQAFRHGADEAPQHLGAPVHPVDKATDPAPRP